MKLLKIKEKLEKKQIKKRIIRKEFQNKSRKQDSKLTIIGITGSRGKSTTELMIHNYLKYSYYVAIFINIYIFCRRNSW